MDSQLVINTSFGLISYLGGWVIRMMWSRNNNIEQDVDDLQRHHDADLKEVRKEMADLALSMPEKYVSKQDMDKLEDFINERFNKLEAKLDQLKS